MSKDEEYYKDLGYDSLMDGVIGEAEKEGKGDKIAKELEEFKKQSQIKAFSVIGVSLATLFYLKIQFDSDPSNFIGGHWWCERSLILVETWQKMEGGCYFLEKN